MPERLRAAHALLEEREALGNLAQPDPGEPEQRGRDGAPDVQTLLAAGVHTLLEEREGLLELAAPEVNEAGQALRDRLRKGMPAGLGGPGCLVEVLDRGVEIAQVRTGERHPRRRRHERDAVLDGHVLGRRRAERVEILPQHALGLPELSLGVIAVAQVAARQSLQ